MRKHITGMSFAGKTLSGRKSMIIDSGAYMLGTL